MGWGDAFSAAWDVATAPARAAAAVVVAGVKAEVWMAEQEIKAAKWAAGEVGKAAVATGHAAVAAAVATEHAAVAAAVATEHAVVAAAKATYAGVSWLFQGVWQSFTGGPKGFVCIPCKILAAEMAVDRALVATAKVADGIYKVAVYDREYAAFQGKQVLICAGEGGKPTFELVVRNAKGSYDVVAEVVPPDLDKDGKPKNATWTTNATKPHTVPAPNVSHVNGINTTPAYGLLGATTLQRELHARCKNRSPATKSCPGCDCVLYTYSEDLGMISDLAQCAAGKLGWNGKIAHQEAQMMRDAIRTGHHLTLSAHSRGSILTENAWNTVAAERSEKHLSDPDVKAAREQAYRDNLEATGDPVAAGIAGNAKAQEIADDKGADDMNANVTVVSSGNAVAFYNPREVGVRMMSTWHGWSVDAVNAPTGSSHGGKMRTVREELPVHRKDMLHHDFGEYYAASVANQVCHPGAKALGPLRNEPPQ